MDKHIYLVRHGESDSNKGGVMRGPAAELTEQGKREAEMVAERVARIGVEALISSPYIRTMDTANTIAKRIGLPVEQNELFKEYRRPSVMIGQSWKDPAMRQMDIDLLQGYADDPSYLHSDEEGFSGMKARADKALAFLAEHPASRICVVSHGLFMRALFGAAVFHENFSGRDLQGLWWNTRMSNTGITVLRNDGKGWFAATWNDDAHLG